MTTQPSDTPEISGASLLTQFSPTIGEAIIDPRNPCRFREICAFTIKNTKRVQYERNEAVRLLRETKHALDWSISVIDGGASQFIYESGRGQAYKAHDNSVAFLAQVDKEKT